jgi:hypothetical protein
MAAAWRCVCLYRAMAPVAEVLAAAAAAPDAQAAVLAATRDALAQAHPPAPGYARRVLKGAMLAVEASGQEARRTLRLRCKSCLGPDVRRCRCAHARRAMRSPTPTPRNS